MERRGRVRCNLSLRQRYIFNRHENRTAHNRNVFRYTLMNETYSITATRDQAMHAVHSGHSMLITVIFCGSSASSALNWMNGMVEGCM